MVQWLNKTYTNQDTRDKAQHPATPQHPSHTILHNITSLKLQHLITTHNVTSQHPRKQPILLSSQKIVPHFYEQEKKSTKTWLCLWNVKRSQKKTGFSKLIQHLEHKHKEELMSIQKKKVPCRRTPHRTPYFIAKRSEVFMVGCR